MNIKAVTKTFSFILDKFHATVKFCFYFITDHAKLRLWPSAEMHFYYHFLEQ